MEPDQRNNDHRRFLKSFSKAYKLGAYFPENLILLPRSEPISFEWLKETGDGAVVFLVSAHCSACRMEPIKEFVSRYEAFRYCILFEGTQETMELQMESYELNVPHYLCDISRLQDQLLVDRVPFTLILSKIGQIVGAGVFNDFAALKYLARPLIKVCQGSV